MISVSQLLGRIDFPRKETATLTRRRALNPYTEWLGIPRHEQPPHYYRLLGIALFEADRELLVAAVRRRKSQLKKFSDGPHAEMARRLLQEVQTAGKCLLDSARRAAYDDRLLHDMSAQATNAGEVYEDSGDPVSVNLLPPRRRQSSRRGRGNAQSIIDVVRANVQLISIVAAICVIALLLFIFLPGRTEHASPSIATAGQNPFDRDPVIPLRQRDVDSTSPSREETQLQTEELAAASSDHNTTAIGDDVVSDVQHSDGKTGDGDRVDVAARDVAPADEAQQLPVYTEEQVKQEIEMLGGTIVRQPDRETERLYSAVDLGGTEATDEIMPYLVNINDLQDLNLKRTKISDEGLSYLSHAENLQALHLGETNVGDAGLAHLAKLRQMKVLRLEQTNVTDDGLVHLSQMTALDRLDLGSTPITDSGMETLQHFAQLRTLALDRTQVGDAGLRYVVRCSRLEQLFLSGSNVTRDGLTQLQGMRKLRRLSVGGPKITQSDVEQLRRTLRPECRIVVTKRK